MTCSAAGCGRPIKQQGLCGMHAQRLWRTGRLDKLKGKYHEINNTPDTRKGRRGYLEANTIDDLKTKAKNRNKSWKLTPTEAFQLITSDCLYCGFKPGWPTSRVGIDRVDNNEGYVISNCVPCCFTCNSAKGDKTLDEFLDWVRAVYARLNRPEAAAS